MAARVQATRRDVHEPRAFLEAFRNIINGPGAPSPVPLPDPLPPDIQQGVLTTMAQRDPNEAAIPLAALRRASFPKLVTSGGHSSVFEAICDVFQQELDAERAIIRGAGHSVPRAGAPFNERLEAFLKGAWATVIALKSRT